MLNIEIKHEIISMLYLIYFLKEQIQRKRNLQSQKRSPACATVDEKQNQDLCIFVHLMNKASHVAHVFPTRDCALPDVDA